MRPAHAARPIPAELVGGTSHARVDPGGHLEAIEGPVTVLAGRLLYEDHRGLGSVKRRRDLDGQPARVQRKRTDRRQDFFGADFMVVEVFERDRRASFDGSCRRKAFVGSATVAADGSFSVPVPERDGCAKEAGEPPDYIIQVSTRHCDDTTCVEIGPTRGRSFTLWFGTDVPLVLGPQGETANTLLFSPSRGDNQNRHAVAANHFAALADAIHVVHIQGGVPFRMERFGGLHVRYPSIWSSGRGTSASLIDINNRGWPKGNLMIHEYGHIVHRRAWNGNYAGYPVPIQSWNGTNHSGETPFIAFKEGWANFLTSYVSGRCFRVPYDERDDLASLERGRNGVHFPQNNRRALCDLVDAHEDRRAGTVVGDRMSLSLWEVWTLVDQTDDLVGRYQGHDPVTEGLDMCDLAEVYLSTRGDSAENVRVMYGVLETNDIWCPRMTDRFASLPPMLEEPASMPPPAER